MRKWIAVFAVVFGLVSVSACGTSGSTIVNTKAGKITQDQFYNQLKDKYGKQVLQDMVYEKLLSQKYKVTDKEINKKIDDLMAQNQITSQDQLKAVLAQNGSSLDDLKENVKMNLLVFKASTDGVKVTDKDLQDYFDKNKDSFIEVKASHILVADEKTANEVEQKLKSGGDFAKLAETYSTDPGSKDKGGDLGYFKKGVMMKPFEDKAFSMKVGQVSEPVKTDAGWHIIKVTGVKDKVSDFKSDVKDAYLQTKAKDAQTVLNKLIKDNDVKVKDKQFKDLFTQTAPAAPTAPSSSGK